MWQLIFRLINGNMLIAAILMIVFVGVFTYFFIVNDHGGNFAFFGPAVVAGMLFPVALSIAVNSSRFNNYGNLILMLVLFLEIILLILAVLNGIAYTRKASLSWVILFIVSGFLFYYTFGTVIGSSVLYFTKDKVTFVRVVWFVAGGLLLGLLFSGAFISGGKSGYGERLIQTDETGAIIGQFGPNAILVDSDDGENMTVSDKYGCRFTYNFGQQTWVDEYGLPVDADKCGFNDAVKGVNIKEHIYQYNKTHYY